MCFVWVSCSDQSSLPCESSLLFWKLYWNPDVPFPRVTGLSFQKQFWPSFWATQVENLSSCMESLQYTFYWQLLVAFKRVFTLLCPFWLSIKKALLLSSVLLISYSIMKCGIRGKSYALSGEKMKRKQPHSSDQRMCIFSSFIKELDWLTVRRTSKLLACLLTRIFSDVSSFVVYLMMLGVSCCICGLLC